MKRKTIIACVAIIVILVGIISTIIIKQNAKKTDTISENNKIEISVFDKENTNIFNKNIETDKEYLINVLKDIEELKVITESGQYGEYITSILDIEQGDDFYWSYYIDDEYAPVGVSNCKIEDGKKYDFKIEKFEQ